MSQQHLAKIIVKVLFKEKTMGSTGSALDEILSSFLHLYIHVFKQVPDFFHLVISFTGLSLRNATIISVQFCLGNILNLLRTPA